MPVITIPTSVFYQHRGFSSGKVLFLIMATIKVFWGRSPVVFNTCTCRNVRTLYSVFFVCLFDFFFTSVFKTHKLISWELKEWLITFLTQELEGNNYSTPRMYHRIYPPYSFWKLRADSAMSCALRNDKNRPSLCGQFIAGPHESTAPWSGTLFMN